MSAPGRAEKFRFLLEEALRHGLEDVAPEKLLAAHLRMEDGALEACGATGRPNGRGRLLVLAAGKASLAQGARQLLGEFPKDARRIAVVPGPLTKESPPEFEILGAEHPVPGKGSEKAAFVVEDAAKALRKEDCLLLLLSGGATSLLAAPMPPLTLRELQQVFAALLQSGATIQEMNAVRKHLTTLGGGKLARIAAPAQLLTLALSDVPGNDPSTIGSGPTVPDPTSFGDALAVVSRYSLKEKFPAPALELLESGAAGKIPETPKAGDPCFERARFALLGTAATLLEKMGTHLALIPKVTRWESDQLGSIEFQVARHLKEIQRLQKEGGPAALLSAGEPTLEIPTAAASGHGGRASHFALEFLLSAEKAGLKNFVLLSAATDGKDGNTGAAGALVDSESLEKARKKGLSPEKALAAFDSGGFFEKTGEALQTGPTGTNFSDVKGIVAW